MPGYSLPTRETDPVHTVRTIGRLAQMVLELRDEYVREQKPDTLDQILRRLEEIERLRQTLDAQMQGQAEANEPGAEDAS